MSIRYTSDQLQRKFPGPAGSPGFARVADGLRAEGRVDEAISLCQEGLRARPVLSGYVVLGKALMDADRMEEAREQFETALRLDPRCLSAMHMLARIMIRLQWADAAAGYYRSILEVEPWDAEIRALLGESSPSGYSASPAAAPSPYAPAAPAEETFEKPAGFDGDVLEVNLNEMAADFLPAGDSTGSPETALEEALEAAPAEASPFRAAAPEALAAPSAEAPADAGDAPPISGQDVEDRLDSLFGSEDSAPASATATWTAAPAHPESPLEGSATATGEMRASETGEMPAQQAAVPFDLATVPDAPGGPPASMPDDFSAIVPAAPAEAETAPGDAPAFEDDSRRVQGEDIERRLDELFNLSEEDDRPPARALSASDLPVAPGPRLDEAVNLGESVSFGGAKPAASPFQDADGTAEATAFSQASATSAAPVTEDVFGTADTAPAALFSPGGTDAEAPAADGEIVTGQDVADKLDNLFGIEADAPAARAPQAAPAFPEPKPWVQDDEPAPPPPAGELMSTESLLPPGWFGDAGDGPRVTGADVEAQLDKLFNLADEPAAPAAMGNVENTVSPTERQAPAAPAMQDDDDDRTLTMPAMKDPSSPAAPQAPADAGRLRESVADWLSRQDEPPKPAADAPDLDGGDTLILPAGDSMDDAQKDFDATLELPSAAKAVADEMESFGTLAPEDMGNLTDTAAIEMVDGGDVAERLDRLFAGPGDAGIPADPASIPEMSLFAQDGPASGPGAPDAAFDPSGTLELPVSGADVSSRLHELFDAGKSDGADTQSAPSGLTHESETGEETPAAPIGDASGAAASRPTPGLAPMTDEEEGYPDDEEMPAQGAAGANVATVTLAEIYFQQGLREQALQIYRQLLEREPENETVRKRIGEIEAAKPEGGDRDPGSDPRRPRPGLKVPKRKK